MFSPPRLYLRPQLSALLSSLTPGRLPEFADLKAARPLLGLLTRPGLERFAEAIEGHLTGGGEEEGTKALLPLPAPNDPQESAIEVLQTLTAITQLTSNIIEDLEPPYPEPLVRGAVALHDILCQVGNAFDPWCGLLAAEIARLCETSWRLQRPCSPSLIPQAFVYLLQRVQSPSAAREDVERLCAFSTSLKHINMGDPSADVFKVELRGAAACSLVLSFPDGCTFAASLITDWHIFDATTPLPEAAANQLLQYLNQLLGDLVPKLLKDVGEGSEDVGRLADEAWDTLDWVHSLLKAVCGGLGEHACRTWKDRLAACCTTPTGGGRTAKSGALADLLCSALDDPPPLGPEVYLASPPPPLTPRRPLAPPLPSRRERLLRPVVAAVPRQALSSCPLLREGD